jgi:hypothetical protein
MAADRGIKVRSNNPISGNNANTPAKKARNIKNRVLRDSLGVIGGP